MSNQSVVAHIMNFALKLDNLTLQKIASCVNWLKKYLEARDDLSKLSGNSVGDLCEGLFRVRPDETAFAELKSSFLDPKTGACIEATLLLLNQNVRSNNAVRGSADCVASLLKFMLRELELELVPFDWAVQVLVGDVDKVLLSQGGKRALGFALAEELLVCMSVHLAKVADEKKTQLAIRVTSSLLSLLCSVSQVNASRMTPYGLLVPLLPSLCGSRDPLAVMKEFRIFEAIKHAQKPITQGNCEGSANNDNQLTRLELLIECGHFIEQTLGDIEKVNQVAFSFREIPVELAVNKTLSKQVWDFLKGMKPGNATKHKTSTALLQFKDPVEEKKKKNRMFVTNTTHRLSTTVRNLDDVQENFPNHDVSKMRQYLRSKSNELCLVNNCACDGELYKHWIGSWVEVASERESVNLENTNPNSMEVMGQEPKPKAGTEIALNEPLTEKLQEAVSTVEALGDGAQVQGLAESTSCRSVLKDPAVGFSDGKPCTMTPIMNCLPAPQPGGLPATTAKFKTETIKHISTTQSKDYLRQRDETDELDVISWEASRNDIRSLTEDEVKLFQQGVVFLAQPWQKNDE